MAFPPISDVLQFMKRAGPTESPVTPSQKQTSIATASSLVRSSPYSSSDLPSAKRQRLDASASATPLASLSATPATNGTTPGSEQAARVRAQYLKDCGETEWVLTVPAIITSASTPSDTLNGRVGEGQDDDIWANKTGGRQTFGSFKRKNKSTTGDNDVTWQPQDASAEANESDYSFDSGIDQSLSHPPSRSSSAAKAKKQPADQRTPSKDFGPDNVDLSKLYSLSGGGANEPSPYTSWKRPKEIDTNRNRNGKSFADRKHGKVSHSRGFDGAHLRPEVENVRLTR